MISFSRIGKQYGRQVLFVDASFQLNPGEKVGLVGPNGAGKTTLFRMIVGEEAADEGDVSVPKRLSIGYFRQDVEEMSGPLGARRGDRRQRPRRRPAPRARGAPARDGRSGPGRRHGPHPGPLRRGAGGVRPPRRLRARGAGARDPARPRLRRRAHRRRRRRAVGRLEDARGDGPGAARPARRAADGRADQPPRHRVDHLARGLPQVAARRAADDLARPRVHEPHRDQDRRDRRRRDHRLLRQLRLLRAGAGDPRGQPRGRLRAPAGDAGQGAALHRPLRRPRRQGGAGAEPGQGAGEDREDRAAQAAPSRAVRLPPAAALRRPGGGARGRAQGLRAARRPRRHGHDHPPRRALVRDGQERRRQVDAAQDDRRAGGARRRRHPPRRQPADGLLRPAVARRCSIPT